MLFAKVIHGFAVSILRITRAFPGFAIIGATPSLLPFPIDTALNKKKYYNRRTRRQEGWNGGWLRKQQTPETRPIPAGDLQDNRRQRRGNSRRKVSPGDYQPVMPGFYPTGPAPAPAHGASRTVAVDNLWITMGLIHMPRIRV